MGDARAQLRAYRYLLAARIRSDWQYRTSFALYTVAQMVVTALDLAVIVVIFDLVPSLGMWSVGEVVVLYGFVTLSFGVADLFISQVETLPRHVQEGTFDRFLLRPLPTIVQLSAAEFALRRVGRVIPGLVSLTVGLAAADIHWSIDRIVLVPTTVVAGTAIFGAVWVVTSSVSFWFVGAREVANSFTYGGSFAHQYPMHIFSEWVRGLIGWVLPLAFVAYIPTIHLLEAGNPLGLPPWLAATPPLVGVVSVGVAAAVWGVGIRNYQSTGS